MGSIKENCEEGREIINSGKGRMEVLRVYRGDAREISQRSELELLTLRRLGVPDSISSSCSQEMIEETTSYGPYEVGQLVVVFANEANEANEKKGVTTLTLQTCPGATFWINDDEELRLFEVDYVPLWVRD